jgi:hypothetical protein
MITQLFDFSKPVVALAPLAVIVVWIGIQPGFFLRRMAPALDDAATAAVQTVDTDYGNQLQFRSLADSFLEEQPLAQRENKPRVR